jgi:hypothetical protein
LASNIQWEYLALEIQAFSAYEDPLSFAVEDEKEKYDKSFALVNPNFLTEL